jgi:hypothetical protein
MTIHRRAILFVAMAVFVAPGAWAADPASSLGLAPGAAAAMQGIDAERIRAHVKFLADDL